MKLVMSLVGRQLMLFAALNLMKIIRVTIGWMVSSSLNLRLVQMIGLVTWSLLVTTKLKISLAVLTSQLQRLVSIR